MSDVPRELIPDPKMTVPKFWQFVGMAKAHPDIRWFDVNVNPMPGDMVTLTYPEWAESFNILIVEDFDWDAFEDLRVEWENTVNA